MGNGSCLSEQPFLLGFLAFAFESITQILEKVEHPLPWHCGDSLAGLTLKWLPITIQSELNIHSFESFQQVVANH